MDMREYKKKIANLSINEQKLRDLYLRDLALGKVQGPPTGYASIDKPWLKYYRENPVKEILRNQTIYELVFDQKDMNKVALGYLGKSITFKELKKKVDKCASAFVNNGVKAGDVVLIGVSNSPEALITMLALNKIGAVSKWFDIRASVADIEAYANSSDCKYAVIFDMIIPKFEKVINNTKLEKVIMLSPADALGVVKKSLYDLKTKKEGSYVKKPVDKRFVTFKTFMRNGKTSDDIKCVTFDPNRSSVMIQSSGTTGKPKTIVHSDSSMINCTRSIAYSDLPLGENKKVLVALPPWIAYGLGDAIILPMALGGMVELCPNFEPNAVYDNIGKFTISYAAPFHYRYIKENYDKLPTSKRVALSNVECMITGGDKISVEENAAFEFIFGTKVVNGYGNNEAWGVLSVNPVENNRYGTVGIPKYDEIIASFDLTTNEELGYGEIGEICALTNTSFLGYESNPESTAEVIRVHDDGKTWLHTGDLGFIDSEGFVNLVGRARRVITRLGFKISAYTIEDMISSNDLVKECVAVSVPDEIEENVPMAYVVLNNNVDENVNESTNVLFDYCKSNLKEYEIPKYIRIVDSLPYTQNGKYDFVKLEEAGKAYVADLKVDKPVKKKIKK